jgi:hypothetical protein
MNPTGLAAQGQPTGVPRNVMCMNLLLYVPPHISWLQPQRRTCVPAFQTSPVSNLPLTTPVHSMQTSLQLLSGHSPCCRRSRSRARGRRSRRSLQSCCRQAPWRGAVWAAPPPRQQWRAPRRRCSGHWCRTPAAAHRHVSQGDHMGSRGLVLSMQARHCKRTVACMDGCTDVVGMVASWRLQGRRGWE